MKILRKYTWTTGLKTHPVVLLIFMLIALLSFPLHAQHDLQGLTSEWSITQHKDLASGAITNKGSLVVLTDQELSWGPSTDEMATMEVNGVRGKWNKAKNLGKMVYDVTMDDGRGKVTFFGTTKGISIRIDLTYNNGSSHLLLTCSSVKYQ